MSVRLLIDSSGDYSLEEAKSKNLSFIPIPISLSGKSYLDGVNLEKDEFYNLLFNSEDFPKTSQPSPMMFADEFKKAKEENIELVVILLSSGLSGTFQTANMVKESVGYDKIYIVDSRHASVGSRLLTDIAIKLREEGNDGQTIVYKLNDIIPRLESVAVVDTLEYLHRGGRLTKAQAKLGEAVNMKPIISLANDGTLYVKDKSLGRSRSYKKIINIFKKEKIDENYPIYFIYSHDKSNCMELFNKIKKINDNIDIKDIYNMGPTIGAHIGSGTFGYACILKEKKDK